jgi:hypothetical protein
LQAFALGRAGTVLAYVYCVNVRQSSAAMPCHFGGMLLPFLRPHAFSNGKLVPQLFSLLCKAIKNPQLTPIFRDE